MGEEVLVFLVRWVHLFYSHISIMNSFGWRSRLLCYMIITYMLYYSIHITYSTRTVTVTVTGCINTLTLKDCQDYRTGTAARGTAGNLGAEPKL